MAKFLTPDSIITMGGVKVSYYPLTVHNPNRIAMPPKMQGSILGVTIHNTGAINAPGTTMAEQYTRATVNGNMNSVRVHYYVDEHGAWQDLPLNWTGWHAADGSGNGNMRTIAIECIMSGNGSESDRKAEDNAARLAAEILKTYGLGIDRLYTHTYWLNVRDGRTGTVDELNVRKHPYKVCPLYIIPHWQSFKASVAGYLGAGYVPESAAPANTTGEGFRVKVVCAELNVRRGIGTGCPIATVVHRGEVFTIMETCKAPDGGLWGRLKSGAGWINIGVRFCKRL